MYDNLTLPMDSLDQRLGEGKGSMACLCSSVLAKTSRCSHLQSHLPVAPGTWKWPLQPGSLRVVEFLYSGAGFSPREHSKGDWVDTTWPLLTKLQNHAALLLLHSVGPSHQRPT